MNNPDSSTSPLKPTVERSPVPLESAVVIPEPVSEAPIAPAQFENLDPLLPWADLIHALTDYEKQRVDPETGQVLTVEQIKVDMPIELRVEVDESGQVKLKGSAPTQRTETTLLPVFHQLQLHIVEDRHGQ
ncbi:MAG: hypothetical protein QNJ46_05795 [Leptolyngbyaceae cyanobacterium MO_188.B28]|nr:hypothetical protein [Leptolyngbyaceae cyanobacterium MO_188.B28]